MAAQDVLDHVRMRWDDEVEYAETLRQRRKVFMTALALVVGIGIFQIDFHVSPDEVVAISNPWYRVGVKLILLTAVGLFVVGAFWLFRSGRNPDSTVSRASELLELDDPEVRSMVASEQANDPSTIIRIKKFKLATLSLEASNRRVSRNLRRGSFLIGMGYLCLILAVGVYTLTRDQHQSQSSLHDDQTDEPIRPSNNSNREHRGK